MPALPVDRAIYRQSISQRNARALYSRREADLHEQYWRRFVIAGQCAARRAFPELRTGCVPSRHEGPVSDAVVTRPRLHFLCSISVLSQRSWTPQVCDRCREDNRDESKVARVVHDWHG